MRHAWTFALLLALALSGCTRPAPDGTDDTSTPWSGQGFAPQTGHQEDATDELSLVGDLYVVDCDTSFCIHAVATNEGSTSWYVESVCEQTPWAEALANEDGPVAKSEPTFHCEAFGTEPFAAGARLEHDFQWDGRLWDDAQQTYEQAPEGGYIWTITFRAYEESTGGASVLLELDFPVIIGET